jgi:hypothetical protein
MSAAASGMISPELDPNAEPMELTDDSSVRNLDPNLSAVLNNLQNGQSLEAAQNRPGQTSDAVDVSIRSPVKSKQKKGHSILKTDTVAKPDPELYLHKFSRVIIETSIKLKDANPFNEFIVSLQTLLKNGQLVDPHFAFCPIKPSSGEKKIHAHADIPINMTMLSAHFQISISNGRNPFEKQKIWGKNATKGKDEFKNPVVFFSMAIATDNEPEELVNRISMEWSKAGGRRLSIKNLQSFKSETIIALFNVYTATKKDTLLSELNKILTLALAEIQEDDSDELLGVFEVPKMDLRLQVPKLPGQDVSHFDKLPYQTKNNRKVLHIECDKDDAKNIRRLVQYAKEALLFQRLWGRHAHISEVANKESTPSKIRRLTQVA